MVIQDRKYVSDLCPGGTGKVEPAQRKYSIFLEVSASNVLNRANLAPLVGVLGLPLFGKSTAFAGSIGSG